MSFKKDIIDLDKITIDESKSKAKYYSLGNRCDTSFVLKDLGRRIESPFDWAMEDTERAPIWSVLNHLEGLTYNMVKNKQFYPAIGNRMGVFLPTSKLYNGFWYIHHDFSNPKEYYKYMYRFEKFNEDLKSNNINLLFIADAKKPHFGDGFEKFKEDFYYLDDALIEFDIRPKRFILLHMNENYETPLTIKHYETYDLLQSNIKYPKLEIPNEKVEFYNFMNKVLSLYD